MAESVRQRIVDDLRITIQAALALPEVRHAVPMLDELKVGIGYVWDYADTYEPDSTTYFSVDLSVGVAIVFRYGIGDRSLYRQGNAFLAELKRAVMADHTRSGLALTTLPIESVVWPIVEAAERNIGATALTLTVNYWEPITDPYATVIA